MQRAREGAEAYIASLQAEVKELRERIVPWDKLGKMLFDYENDRQAPEHQLQWDKLEEWQRQTWIEEAKAYWTGP